MQQSPISQVAIVPDPVFIAIARHKVARARFDRADDRTRSDKAAEEGRIVTAADRAEYTAADAAECVAFNTFITTIATTLPGLRASIAYYAGLNMFECANEVAVTGWLASPVFTMAGES